MGSGVYKITNPKGEIYIGRSKNLTEREKKYINGKIKNQPLIYESISMYGWDKHTFDIIELCPIEDLNKREKYWIKYYNSYNSGLNKNLGGGGPIAHTTNTRVKMSLAKKDNLSESHINAIRKANSTPKPHITTLLKNQPSHFSGKTHTLESRKKMSLAKKGKTYEEIYGIEQAKDMKKKKSLPRKGKSILCINEDKIFSSIREAATYYSISENSIGNILLGYSQKTKTSLIFKYANQSSDRS
jgi:group I intron endonuclease